MTFKNLPFWNSKKSVAKEDDHPFRSIQHEMNQMFDNFFQGFGFTPSRMNKPFEGFAPSIDFAEHQNEYDLSIELPGMDAKSVDLSIDDNMLTIKGEKKVEEEKKEKNYHYTERSYGSFMRSFPLPPDVVQDRIEANFDKGVLKIMMPKSEERLRSMKRIPIKDDIN